MNFLLLICFLIFHFAHSTATYNFKTVYEWKQIEYEFESEDQRIAAIANGSFLIGRVQPIDVQQTNIKLNGENMATRYFVTTPRLNSTIPASLSVITNNTINGNPMIAPYPHWSWHVDTENCNKKRLVSAFRVWEDECGRLWVIDTGMVGDGNFVCNPQILAFDLLTDELVHKYEIPQSMHKNRASYNTLIAEVLDKAGACLNTWIYVADPKTPSLLVYSLKLNQSWIVKDISFEASPQWSKITVAGDTLLCCKTYGIESLALSPPDDGDQRKLAYHAMANINESYVYTKEIRNISLLENGVGNLFHTYSYPRNQQSTIEAYDRSGTLHFPLLSDIKIVSWNSKKEYRPENFLVVGNNQQTMQFPTGLKIGKTVQNLEGIWVFSTRLQKWDTSSLSVNEINFRILFASFHQ